MQMGTNAANPLPGLVLSCIEAECRSHFAFLPINPEFGRVRQNSFPQLTHFSQLTLIVRPTVSSRVVYVLLSLFGPLKFKGLNGPRIPAKALAGNRGRSGTLMKTSLIINIGKRYLSLERSTPLTPSYCKSCRS